MSVQQEDAVLNVKIDGSLAAASLKELNDQVKYLTTSLENMHKADNPGLYQSRVVQLQAVKAARDAERASINQTTDAVKKQQDGWANAFSTIKSGMAGLGISVGIGLLISFGKELLNIEVKASGIQNAFAKIGNTAGMLDKLRAAANGLISDLDLEKIAVKANNANIPLDKMSLLLSFAAQRARDTGEDVTALTEKLIVGLGKGGTRSLAGLGISVKEVKDEFKKTGDMVEAVSNIIQRQMLDSGKDVDSFGDKVIRLGSRWENTKKNVGNFFQFLFGREIADSDEIQKRTNDELKKYQGYEKFQDDMLNDSIKKQAERVKKLQVDYAEKTAEYEKFTKTHDRLGQAQHALFGGLLNRGNYNDGSQAKRAAEVYQASRDALVALNKEKEKRTQKSEEDGEKGTVEYIDKQISDLKKEQKEVSKTSDEWKKYEEQLKKLQEQRDAITGGKKDKKGESERERALKNFQQLAIDQKQFEAADLAAQMAKNDKEIAEEQLKYDKFIQKEKDFLKEKGTTQQQRVTTNNNIARLEAEKQQAVIDLRVKQEKELTDKITEFRDQMSGKLETELEKERTQINAKFDQLEKDAGENADQLATIELGRQAALNDAKLREKQRFEEEALKIEEIAETDPAKKAEIEKQRINKKYDDEIAALKKKYTKELQATKEFQNLMAAIEHQRQGELKKSDETIKKAALNAAIDSAQEISNATFQIAADNRHAETDAKISALENEKNAELNNANLTQTQKDAINQKFAAQEAELKKQAFENDKKASLEQAIINGALAITKTFADYGFTPLGWIAAAAQAVATIAQIDIIESQPTPQFADGGFLPTGPLHTQGGINLVGPYGRVLGQVEGGEPILSRSTYANNRGVVNALLQSKGGPVDYDKVNQATTAREIRRSGVQPNRPEAGSGAKVTQSQQFDPNALITEVRRVGDIIDAKEWSINRRAWDKESERVDQIRNNANS